MTEKNGNHVNVKLFGAVISVIAAVLLALAGMASSRAKDAEDVAGMVQESFADISSRVSVVETKNDALGESIKEIKTDVKEIKDLLLKWSQPITIKR
jgi:septal ring factor EnvC (AmiA/AmiB activator)